MSTNNQNSLLILDVTKESEGGKEAEKEEGRENKTNKK